MNTTKLRALFKELLKTHDYRKAVRGVFESDVIVLDVDTVRQLPALLDRLDKLEAVARIGDHFAMCREPIVGHNIEMCRECSGCAMVEALAALEGVGK